MALIILFFLLTRPVHIFMGFTFTDAEDFAPLFSLLVGVALIGVATRRSRQEVPRPLILSLFLLSTWPILPNVGLFFMAQEFESMTGAWPQVMVNDPRNTYGLSPTFDSLLHVVNYLEAFSGAWMILFIYLFLRVWRRLAVNQLRWCTGFAAVLLIVALADPGNLFAWWLD